MTALFLLTACYAGSKLDDENVAYYNCISQLSWKHATKNTDTGELTPVGETQISEGIPACITDKSEAAARVNIADPYVVTASKKSQYISLRFSTMIVFAILWIIYILFWSVQLGRLWNKSKFVVGD